MKRDAAQTIFRTVVFAGAMLGAGAGCSKKQAATTPTNTQTEAQGAGTDTPPTTDNASADPCGGGSDIDPCTGEERPRGTDEDGGGGMGRGFILS